MLQNDCFQRDHFLGQYNLVELAHLLKRQVAFLEHEVLLACKATAFDDVLESVALERVEHLVELSTIDHELVKVTIAKDLWVLSVNFHIVKLREEQACCSADIAWTQVVVNVEVSRDSHLV